MSDIPNFADLGNYRYNSFSNTETPKLIGYGAVSPELRTIPATAPYRLILHESPQFNVPNTTAITDLDTATVLTGVSKTTTPANNEYRINYDERGNGEVEFNAAQKGHSISIKYYGLGSIAKIETLQSTQGAITNVQIQTLTTDTILSDNQGSGTLQLEFDCRIEDVEATLPDVATNRGLQIGFKQLYLGGRGILTGKGGDTVDGYTSIYIDDKNNSGKLYSNGTEWKILNINHTIKFFDNYRPNSDWTNRKVGSLVVLVDNEDPGNPIEGEQFIEAVSGLEFTLQEYDAVNHFLYFKNAQGNCTNNRQLVGQVSGWTCDVNEVTGSTKNRDSYLFHNTNRSIYQFRIKYYISSDGTDNNIVIYREACMNVSHYGIYYSQIDNNNINQQHLNLGDVGTILGTGINYPINTQNWYYGTIMEVLY